MRNREFRDAMKEGRTRKKSATPEPAVAGEDRNLFRSAIGPVRPLAHVPDLRPGASKPSPQARQFEIDEAAVRDELLSGPFDPGMLEMGDEILYLKPGSSPRLLKRLRRGQFSIQAEIDLHQMTVAVARTAVSEFLNDAIRHHELCVRIVHGKGLRSASRGPVVKRMTEQLLRRRDDVIAFASALPAQGGTGAVLVLLRGD
jgi:DNA-nicking Smr family endonuclease